MKCKMCSINDAIKYGKYTDGNFCSKNCAMRWVSTQNRSEKNKKISLSLAKNEIYVKKCSICGNIFNTKRNHQKYCSIKCSRLNFSKSCIGRKFSKERNNKISETRKKLFKNKKLKVTGGTTKWYDVNTSKGIIRVQGSYEVKACEILDKMKSDKKIKDWEYTKDTIEYYDVDNKLRNYLIDFKLFNFDNSFYYVEVKGKITENDILKWKSVEKHGFKLEIWKKQFLFGNLA